MEQSTRGITLALRHWLIGGRLTGGRLTGLKMAAAVVFWAYVAGTGIKSPNIRL